MEKLFKNLNQIPLTPFNEQRFPASDVNLEKYRLRFLNKKVKVKFPNGTFEGCVKFVNKTGDYPGQVCVIIENDKGERRSVLGLRKIVLLDIPVEA